MNVTKTKFGKDQRKAEPDWVDAPSLMNAIAQPDPDHPGSYLLDGFDGRMRMTWDPWKHVWIVLCMESSDDWGEVNGIYAQRQRETWKAVLDVPEQMGGVQPDQRLLNYLRSVDRTRVGADVLKNKYVEDGRRRRKIEAERAAMKTINEEMAMADDVVDIIDTRRFKIFSTPGINPGKSGRRQEDY